MVHHGARARGVPYLQNDVSKYWRVIPSQLSRLLLFTDVPNERHRSFPTDMDTPTMSLSLLASLEGSLERHCSLCRIFERDQGGCDHTQSEPVLSMVNSESSFYTARTTTSVEVSASTLYRRPAVSRTVSEASFAVPQRGRTLRR